ncbi:unnamed protein product [Tetraodon nigroviridis]|uniref:(spotted green pufferfish) hypothetical protein n=1 Tax=Tetraodon nigroviridis TaxID=99883 RepID=Q4SU40_TETNG|nr:unnamed protein product [Tetraodon nigroviridis]
MKRRRKIWWILLNSATKCEEAEHCVHARERMEECETRVGSRSSTQEDCTEELFDFLHARDHCVAHKLFHSVK